MVVDGTQLKVLAWYDNETGDCPPDDGVLHESRLGTGLRGDDDRCA